MQNEKKLNAQSEMTLMQNAEVLILEYIANAAIFPSNCQTIYNECLK